MMHDWELVDEELIRAAAADADVVEPGWADHPITPRAASRTPSGQLRRRVLRAARTACRRRQWRRRLLFAATIVSSTVALGSWYQGFVARRANLPSAVWTSPGANNSGPQAKVLGGTAGWHGSTSGRELGSQSPAPTRSDWDAVEASFERRREHSRIIRSALY